MKHESSRILVKARIRDFLWLFPAERNSRRFSRRLISRRTRRIHADLRRFTQNVAYTIYYVYVFVYSTFCVNLRVFCEFCGKLIYVTLRDEINLINLFGAEKCGMSYVYFLTPKNQFFKRQMRIRIVREYPIQFQARLRYICNCIVPYFTQAFKGDRQFLIVVEQFPFSWECK